MQKQLQVFGKNKVLILGDVHGNFDKLVELVNDKTPELVLQCGDFGIFPDLNSDSNNRKSLISNYDYLKDLCCPVYFIDGNHENFSYLNTRNEKDIRLIDVELPEHIYNIKYLERGTILEIDNKKILFIGGAESIDKKSRISYVDWFPEETITYKEIYSILNKVDKVDIIISHCAPKEFDIVAKYTEINDTSRQMLSVLLNELKPEKWIFGHYHFYKTGKYKDTYWTALNIMNNNNGYVWLTDIMIKE